MAAIPTTNPFFSGAVSSGSALHSSSFHPIKRFSSISLNVSPSKPRPISAYFHESGDVTQVKIKATDGDDAVKLTNPGLGLLEKSGIIALRHRLQSVEAGYEPNQRLMIEELFKVGNLIMVKHNHSDLPNNKRSSKFDPIFLTKRRAFAPFFSHFQLPKSVAIFMGAGIALLSIIAPCNAAEFSNYREPWNALSIPTWAVHVSSVVEWATAMVLVWRYGEKSGLESWKGLSWGMVPLLAGALCACTWHFFYNSESLEVLVALQAAFTVFGNTTMCIAAYRIYMSSQEEL